MFVKGFCSLILNSTRPTTVRRGWDRPPSPAFSASCAGATFGIRVVDVFLGVGGGTGGKVSGARSAMSNGFVHPALAAGGATVTRDDPSMQDVLPSCTRATRLGPVGQRCPPGRESALSRMDIDYGSRLAPPLVEHRFGCRRSPVELEYLTPASLFHIGHAR